MWSPNKIKVLEECPYRFFLTYVSKPKDNKKDLNKVNSNVGSVIHSAISYSLKEKVPLNQSLMKYGSTLSQYSKQKVLSLIPNISYFFNQIKDYPIVSFASELRIKSDKFNLFGIVDFVIAMEKDILAYEFKTVDNFFKLQPEIYQGLLQEKFPDKTVTTKVFSFKSGKELYSISSFVNLEDVIKYSESLLRKAMMENYPKKEGHHCQYCNFRKICKGG